ncbi:hypothetical protein ACLESO_40365 [Pyxidicoccus sp. 3LG]
MSDGSLFSTDRVTTEARYQWHLWLADLLDLATAALVGWAALRLLERERTLGSLALAMALAWLVTSAVGGLTGRTFWRQLAGVRLVKGERAPGLVAGLLRAFTVPVDMLLTVVVQHRSLDTKLGLYAERVPPGVGARLKGLALQLPWLAVLAGAVWLLVHPHPGGALKYLGAHADGVALLPRLAGHDVGVPHLAGPGGARGTRRRAVDAHAGGRLPRGGEAPGGVSGAARAGAHGAAPASREHSLRRSPPDECAPAEPFSAAAW